MEACEGGATGDEGLPPTLLELLFPIPLHIQSKVQRADIFIQINVKQTLGYPTYRAPK